MDVLLSRGRILVALCAAGLVAGSFVACSSSDGGGASPDDAGTEDEATDAFASFDGRSNCGHPGDKGNSLGVGQFCIVIADCFDNAQAKLCTTFGDPDNYFCTFRCNKDDPPGTCGEQASCQCDSQGSACGCFPDRCGDTDSGADATTDASGDAADAD